MLAQMPKADEATRYGSNSALLPEAPTLADLGIERMQSSRWQQIARLPEQSFEELISTLKTE